jgi:hypothetical protein
MPAMPASGGAGSDSPSTAPGSPAATGQWQFGDMDPTGSSRHLPMPGSPVHSYGAGSSPSSPGSPHPAPVHAHQQLQQQQPSGLQTPGRTKYMRAVTTPERRAARLGSELGWPLRGCGRPRSPDEDPEPRSVSPRRDADSTASAAARVGAGSHTPSRLRSMGRAGPNHLQQQSDGEDEQTGQEHVVGSAAGGPKGVAALPVLSEGDGLSQHTNQPAAVPAAATTAVAAAAGQCGPAQGTPSLIVPESPPPLAAAAASKQKRSGNSSPAKPVKVSAAAQKAFVAAAGWLAASSADPHVLGQTALSAQWEVFERHLTETSAASQQPLGSQVVVACQPFLMDMGCFLTSHTRPMVQQAVAAAAGGASGQGTAEPPSAAAGAGAVAAAGLAAAAESAGAGMHPGGSPLHGDTEMEEAGPAEPADSSAAADDQHITGWLVKGGWSPAWFHGKDVGPPRDLVFASRSAALATGCTDVHPVEVPVVTGRPALSTFPVKSGGYWFSNAVSTGEQHYPAVWQAAAVSDMVGHIFSN